MLESILHYKPSESFPGPVEIYLVLINAQWYQETGTVFTFSSLYWIEGVQIDQIKECPHCI